MSALCLQYRKTQNAAALSAEVRPAGRDSARWAKAATDGYADAAAALSPLQAMGALEGARVQETAAAGVAGGGSALPHAEAIQRSFGRHDVGGVQAHVGGRAASAAGAIGAEAYTTGSHVAFAAAPSLHLAAHEAAHVVQQRAGVNLPGGVGQVGDVYERHADQVADAVVAGRSAEGLLDTMAGGGAAAGSVQMDRGADPTDAGHDRFLELLREWSMHDYADEIGEDIEDLELDSSKLEDEDPAAMKSFPKKVAAWARTRTRGVSAKDAWHVSDNLVSELAYLKAWPEEARENGNAASKADDMATAERYWKMDTALEKALKVFMRTKARFDKRHPMGH